MISDPDAVLKSFGQTAETQFSLLYAVQLFLSVENGQTHRAYDTPAEDAYRLCAAPNRMPAHIRDFILWQKNILKLDDIEILETELPRGLKHKYPVKASRLAEIESSDERAALIQTLLEELNGYFNAFNEMRAIVEATEDRFMTVEETLLRAESMDDGIARAMAEHKAELERMRISLTELRGDLEDPALPDLIKFEGSPQKAWELMRHLSEVNLQARDAIRLYDLECG